MVIVKQRNYGKVFTELPTRSSCIYSFDTRHQHEARRHWGQGDLDTSNVTKTTAHFYENNCMCVCDGTVRVKKIHNTAQSLILDD